MFPRSTQYAIRAMTFLAAQGRLCGAREIAEAEHIPMPFLWKILQKLAARKLIRSFRGVRGGCEMEKSQSSVVPLLLIVALILAIVGVSGYYLLESRKVLANQDAAIVATSVLKAQGPAVLKFHTGVIKSSVDDKPHDPHYRLLEKA